VAESAYLRVVTSHRYSPTLCSQDRVCGCACSKIANGIFAHHTKNLPSGLTLAHLPTQHSLNWLASETTQPVMLITASYVPEVEQNG